MFFILRFFFFFFFLNPLLSLSIAQGVEDERPKNQIELLHDNDFIISDRYYTTGLFLTYRRQLTKGIFNSGKEQVSFQFLTQAYTPRDIRTVNINKFDRPYAGFSGIQMGWSFAKSTWMVETKLLVGLTGPSSGAGGFQRWFHGSVTNVSVPKWIGEIEDSFHTNLALTFIKEWQLTPNPFSIHFALKPTIAFGTKDVFFQPEAIVFFGRRNTVDSSIAFNQIGSIETEVYLSLRLAYRFVEHNALLEGNILGDNSVFTIEPNRKLIEFGIDLNGRSAKNDYKLGLHTFSEEASGLSKHRYLSIAYARSF